MDLSSHTHTNEVQFFNFPPKNILSSLVRIHCFSFPSSPLGQPVVADASCALSRAVCIATRYGAVRRQFGSENGGPQDPGIAIEPNPF